MIVITAPTSQIGSKVVNNLIGINAPLRLIVRDAAKLPSAVRDRTEVIEGSHGDGSVVVRAFEGADAVFWIAPPDATKTLEQAWLDFTRPAAAAIRRHKVPRLVSITALGRGTPWENRAGPVTASLRMDDMLMESGAAYRALAMPSFMENTLRQAAVMKEKGMFFGPIRPNRKLPFTATRDMAATAARLLSDQSWDGQKELPVLGPDDLSFDDQATIISETIGRPVRYQPISFDQFKQQFLARGASESFAQGYVDMYRAKDEGIDNVALRTPENTAPTSFRTFCEQVSGPLSQPRKLDQLMPVRTDPERLLEPMTRPIHARDRPGAGPERRRTTTTLKGRINCAQGKYFVSPMRIRLPGVISRVQGVHAYEEPCGCIGRGGPAGPARA